MDLQSWTVIGAIAGIVGIPLGLVGIGLTRAQGKPDVSIEAKVDCPSFGTKISAPIIYVCVHNISSTAVTVRDVQARWGAG